MFKIVSYVLAYFFGSASKNVDLKGVAFEVLEEAVYRSRKTVALVLGGLCSTILVCGGFFIALLNASSQYDRTGHVYATATLWSGIALTVIFLGAAYYIFAVAWPGVHSHNKTTASTNRSHFQSTHHPSDLEKSISILIMDFVDSRRIRREERRHDRANREARWEAKHAKSSPPPPPSASGPH